MKLWTDGTLAPTIKGYAGGGYVIELDNGEIVRGNKYFGRGESFHSGTAEFAAFCLGLNKLLTLGINEWSEVDIMCDCAMVVDMIDKNNPDHHRSKPYYQFLVEALKLLKRIPNHNLMLINRAHNIADDEAQKSISRYCESPQWTNLLFQDRLGRKR